MSYEWILQGESLNLASADEIGGKAVNLRKLRSEAFTVPDFVVIPNSAIAKLNQSPMPADFLAALVKYTGTDFCLSVRSSVADEDGLNASFAGMMSTVLNVKDHESLVGAIQKVAASAHSELVRNYRKNQSVQSDDIKMGIILQQMIHSEVSGVLFTAHPTTGNRDQMCLSAAFGLGEGVVTGFVDCDEWDYDWKKSQEISERISRKEKFVTSKRSASGVEVQEIGQAQQSVSSLDSHQRQEIYRVGLEISMLYSWPQDIEWCWANGKLVILQSRPITAKSLLNSWGDHSLYLNNANIQESFCGLTLPLTFSFANEAYRQAYNQSLKLMNFSQDDIQKHNVRHSKMLAIVQGQVYYNIWSWYEGLLILPSFGKNKADMEKMMGLESPLDFVQSQSLTLGEKIKKLPAISKLVMRLGWKFLNIKAYVETFLMDFEQKYSRFDRRQLFLLTETEIFSAIQRYKSEFIENWSTPILNDFYVMMNNGKVMRVLEKLGLQEKYAELLMGENLESTEHTKKLIRLSNEIKKRSFGKELLRSAKTLNEVRERLKGLAPDLFIEVEEYLYRYGDRVPGELKLETLSSFQDGSFVLDCLRHLSSDSKPVNLEENESILRSQAEQLVFLKVRQSLGLIKFLGFKSSLKKLRYGIKAREAMRLERTRSFGVFRALYSELGLRWQNRQIILDSRDIFYLTESEINDHDNGKSFLLGVQEIIGLRKNAALEFKNSSLDGALSLSRPVSLASFASSSDQAPSFKMEDSLQGIGCFPGVVSAAVCRMPELSTDKSVDGKILATVRTDPGWAPLFPRIKGLLVERGSRLSHSAIVARELGIPTIVNLPNLMKWISDNEVLRMDGETGVIRKEYGIQRNAETPRAFSKN